MAASRSLLVALDHVGDPSPDRFDHRVRSHVLLAEILYRRALVFSTMPLPSPRDKHDLDAVEALAAHGPLSEAEIGALLPWMMDANWSVAQALAPVLARQDALVAPLRRILTDGEDADFDADATYHLLVLLEAHLSPEQREALRPSLQRFVTTPTAEEREIGLDELAADVLAFGT